MLEGLAPKVKIWPCAVRSLLESLDKKDAEILSAAVMDPNWSYQGLETALAERGLTLGAGNIKRHRAKGCSCWKI